MSLLAAARLYAGHLLIRAGARLLGDFPQGLGGPEAAEEPEPEKEEPAGRRVYSHARPGSVSLGERARQMVAEGMAPRAVRAPEEDDGAERPLRGSAEERMARARGELP